MPNTYATNDSSIVCISTDEHNRLVQIAVQYDTLCGNLISGGVDSETIKLLSSRITPATAQEGSNETGNPSALRCGGRSIFQRYDRSRSNSPSQSSAEIAKPYQSASWDNSLDSSDSGSECAGEDEVKQSDKQPETCLPLFQREATRTVVLFNLENGTTYADITSVIRGGFLLHIFLNFKEHYVSHSFLHSSDAADFHNHVHHKGLYIRNKKVGVKWGEHQYFLGSHIAHQIGRGACRNLIVRRCDPTVVIHDIRSELQHIHNLRLVSVEVIAGDCYISTNSVTGAMFARTCMMSRLKYKKTRIDWGMDECAQPLDRMPIPQRHVEVSLPVKPAWNPSVNRFNVLEVDGDEDGG